MIAIKLERSIYDYVKIEDVKNYLRVSHDIDDEIIKLAIEASCKFIHEYCNYILVQAIITFTVENYRRDLIGNNSLKTVYIPYRPATKLIKIITDDEIELEGKLKGDTIIIYNNVFKCAVIVYKAGYDEIPADLKMALFKICADMYFNRTTQVQMNTDTLNILNNYRLVNV